MRHHNFIWLGLFMIVLMLASCTATDVPEDSGPSVSKADSVSENEQDTVTTEEKLTVPPLPERDMDGFELNMAKVEQSQIAWATVLFAPEEITGEIINDDIFERNDRLQAQYNFVLKESAFSDMSAEIKNLVQAQDDTYDVYFHTLSSIAPQSLNGSFVDLRTISSMDLNQKWWDQGMIRDLEIFGKMCFIVGDIVLTDNDCMQIIYYNKQLAEDLHIDNLYALVRDGKWTADRMKEMMSKAIIDMDGDGAMTQNDRFGLLYVGTTRSAMLAGMNGRIALLDEEGIPSISANSEATVNAFEKTASIFQLPNGCFNFANFTGLTGRDGIVAMFQANRTLFYGNNVSAAAQYMRDVDADFGFLPYPKLDEGQDKYYAQVNYNMPVLMIPVCSRNIEDTGFILEVLSRDSGESVLQDYYETCFSAKYIRDQESYDMLLIAVENHIYDVGAVFNWGNLSSNVADLLISGKDTYTSTVEKYRHAAESQIEEMIESFKES